LPRQNADLEIDLTEVRGQTYRCLDGCSLCCLCQPELLPKEEERFRTEPHLSRGLAEKHISPDVRGAAISLRGAHGACFFLRERRCSIYADRPHYCRAFPISLFAGWRIQANVNLSCRGIGLPGESLETLAADLLRGFDERAVRTELEAARKVFSEFTDLARQSRVDQSGASVRAAAEGVMEDFGDEIGLSRILTYAQNGNTRQNSSPQEIARRARKSEADADINEIAMANGTELFDLPDLSYLPVYIDEKMTWRIFKLEGETIAGYVLSEDGTLSESSRTAPSEISLMPMTPEGKAALAEYLGVVNGRDCFLGHAAHLCDMEDYSYNFAQVYLGAMATAAVDLWWRATFLATLEGRHQLDSADVREGIVFYDMDLLDQPTIGAFL
jgi:Fe-S-cluster containining protein